MQSLHRALLSESWRRSRRSSGKWLQRPQVRGKPIDPNHNRYILIDRQQYTGLGDEQEFKVVDLGNMQYQFVSDVNGEALQVNSNGTVTPGSGSNNQFNVYSVGSTIPVVITSLSGNTYQVTNQNSGYEIDVDGASVSSGAVVDQWPYNGGTNQQWTFSNTGNGFYTLTNVNSGLLLDVENASTSEGALIDQYSSNGGLNQQWNISAP